ncbi:MAG: formate/nitrite transporter family protein [Deltaproteobacteria bacterium]|nr:formate/nitrite transporter family protein [Deltaproteobacteria bacterium]
MSSDPPNPSSGEHLTVVSPSLPGPTLLTLIAREGREELRRPVTSLWWSAVAAGLVMSLSAACKAYLHARIPDEPWRLAITSFGYSVGFVVVVLGRLQLFTENTITTILPLLTDRTRSALFRTARLWTVVLIGNLVGCFAAAALIHYVQLAPDAPHDALLEISRHYADRSWSQMLTNGIPAGFLVAAMVWASPAAGSSRFWLILFLSYMISVGDLTHIIAGSVELFVLLLAGETSIQDVLVGGVLATGAGNILGGTVFFALLAYAQGRDEIEDEEPVDESSI